MTEGAEVTPPAAEELTSEGLQPEGEAVGELREDVDVDLEPAMLAPAVVDHAEDSFMQDDDEREAERENMRAEIQQLEIHRDNCAQQALYDEATYADRRIDELKKMIFNSIEVQLLERQQQERSQLETDQKDVLQEFVQRWEDRLTEFERRAAILRQDVKQKQAAEMEELWKEIRAQPQRPKFPQRVLHRRNVETQFARRRMYDQAARVRREREAMENRFLEEYDRQTQESAYRREEQLIAFQKAERAALVVKLDMLRKEGMAHRQRDLQRLLKLFHNNEIGLDIEQGTERVTISKFAQSFTTPSASMRSPRVAPKSPYGSGRPVPQHTPHSRTASLRADMPSLWPELSGAVHNNFAPSPTDGLEADSRRRRPLSSFFVSTSAQGSSRPATSLTPKSPLYSPALNRRGPRSPRTARIATSAPTPASK